MGIKSYLLNMKRAILIHGWGGVPEEGWRPWLRGELEKRGFKVLIPAMPDTKHPKLSAWVGKIAESVGKPDKHTYLVGHSLGPLAILRYLESLKPGEEVGGAVFVAGFSSELNKDNIDDTKIRSFFDHPVDWEKVKKHCRVFVAINSDNDPFVPVEEGDIFKEKLGAELIVKHNMGHLGVDNGITEFPDVLDSILKLSE